MITKFEKILIAVIIGYILSIAFFGHSDIMRYDFDDTGVENGY